MNKIFKIIISSYIFLITITGCVPLVVGTGVGYYAAQSGPTLSDTEITTKVKTKLLSKPGISSTLISVSTNNSVVTLTGNLPSKDMRNKAVNVAQQTTGVKKVNNYLTSSV